MIMTAYKLHISCNLYIIAKMHITCHITVVSKLHIVS